MEQSLSSLILAEVKARGGHDCVKAIADAVNRKLDSKGIQPYTAQTFLYWVNQLEGEGKVKTRKVGTARIVELPTRHSKDNGSEVAQLRERVERLASEVSQQKQGILRLSDRFRDEIELRARLNEKTAVTSSVKPSVENGITTH